MTLAFGTSAEARVPNLGASGAIAAVLGAYFVLYPNSNGARARGHLPGAAVGLVLPRRLVPLPADRGELRDLRLGRERGGVAFFAHVGGFVFGVIVALLLTNAGRVTPQDRSRTLSAPA